MNMNRKKVLVRKHLLWNNFKRIPGSYAIAYIGGQIFELAREYDMRIQ